jgi:hypothetical protein
VSPGDTIVFESVILFFELLEAVRDQGHIGIARIVKRKLRAHLLD